jgi:SAM-dependent methyltransferase
LRPPALPPEGIGALRADLAAARYTVDGIEEALGPVAVAALNREEAVPARRVVRARRDPVAILLRTFVLGEPVLRRELDAALPRLTTSGAVRAGLVRAGGAAADDEIRGVVDLGPYAAQDAAGTVHWWLASDVGELASGRPLAPDHVLGVGGASTTLARITVRDRVARALDIGTGCGIQALHAARHADGVVATDVSARALAFARLNAALADVDVDLRRGSLLEPVTGETFDLVVSNPPFVVTPRRPGGLPRYTYRDGGRAGDALVQELVEGVGAVLAPGGVAQLLGSWEHRRGEGWRERVTGWLAASGLDGWVIQREASDPAEYAETWLRDGGLTADRDPRAWREAYEAWLDDFEARGVEAVGFGYVVLRRPASGTPASGRMALRRVEDQRGRVDEPLGSHFSAALRAHDLLARTDDTALLTARLVVAEDVTEERYLRPGDADPQVVQLRQGGGLGRVVPVSAALAGIVGACDGELPLGRLVGAVAELLALPGNDLVQSLLPAVRELLRDGFLRPAEAAAPA